MEAIAKPFGASLFSAHFTSFHIYFVLLAFFLRFFDLYLSICFDLQVLGTALLRELHILYNQIYGMEPAFFALHGIGFVLVEECN